MTEKVTGAAATSAARAKTAGTEQTEEMLTAALTAEAATGARAIVEARMLLRLNVRF
jgi:hypothetical protein